MVNHKWIKESLLAFKKVMDEAKVDFWLEYGTQLGAVREGRIISWDLDGDVGVWLKDIEKMKTLEKEFKENGMYIAYQPGHAFLNYMIDKERQTYLATVDIYTFKVVDYNGKQYVVRIEHGEIYDVRSPEEYYRLFRNVFFLGTNFAVPFFAEKALEFAYGKEWRQPIKRPSLTISMGPVDKNNYGVNGRTHHWKLEDLNE